MSLTEKWERFKAEQKDPTLVVTEDAPVIRESQTTEKMSDNFEKMSDNFRPTIRQRIYELNQAVENMAAKMLSDNIAYSVRHHLMQARLAEARHILKLMEQDSADQNT
jgi:hypothetical protein